MNTLQLIYTKNISTLLDPIHERAIKTAMAEYAERLFHERKNREEKAISIQSVKIISSILHGNFKLALRKMAFRKAVKEADARALTENRKIYVIRSGEVSYVTMSTKDVEQNKRTHVFNKRVNSVTLHDTADYVAYPKN